MNSTYKSFTDSNESSNSHDWKTVGSTSKPKKTLVDTFNNIKSNSAEKAAESINVSTSASAQKQSRIPSGIVAKLDAATKQIIREVLPNSGKNVADTKIMEMIVAMRNDSTLKLIDFKRRIVMICHQAIKKDRGPLVVKIFEMWQRSKFPLIELIDSTFDNCKPITQAAWCGSIECIRLIVSLDPTNAVLQTINSKGETLDNTLTLGKSYALGKDPSNAVFIAERFNQCQSFLTSALATQKRHQTALDTVAEPDATSTKCDSPIISKQAIAEISEIVDSEIDIMLKIVSVYGDDNELAQQYYLAAKECVSPEMFASIGQTLKDEGITF
jgi:hypothetical protein